MRLTAFVLISIGISALGVFPFATGSATPDDSEGAAPKMIRTPPGKVFEYKVTRKQSQKIEIYFPKDFDPAKQSVPGVLLFHGGGWSGGDLKQFRYACEYFAKRGLVASTANYYMHDEKEREKLGTGGKRKRVCVTDAASAIRWFKQHARELGVDPKRVVVGGGSAGGHIAVLATLNRNLDDPADPKDVDTSVVAYLLFNPAFMPEDADRDPEVDAFKHVRAGIAPSLFLFGEKDAWKGASEKLVPVLRKQNARAELLVADDVGHSFWTKPQWYDRCLAECDRFLVSLKMLEGDPLVKTQDGFDFNPKKSSR